MFSVPKNYVRFGTFTYARENIFTEKKKSHSFLCGICAGGAESILVVTPQETLKTKLVHDKLQTNPQYKNLFHGIYSIYQAKGFWGMYRGVVPTFMKQSSN